MQTFLRMIWALFLVMWTLLRLFLVLTLIGALFLFLFWSFPLPVILKVTALEPGGEPLANVPVNIYTEGGSFTTAELDMSTDTNGCFGLVSYRSSKPYMIFLLKVETLSFDLEKENESFFGGIFRVKVADLKVGETLYSVDGSVYLSPEADQPATYTLNVLGLASPFGRSLRPHESVCATEQPQSR